MRSRSAGFQAETMRRRESGLRRISSSDPGDLVDGAAVGLRPGAPLLAVDRPEIAVRRRPTRPRSRRRSPAGSATLVSPARNHSSSWMIDFRCSFFVVTSGKPSRQVEAHLMAEDRERAGAGAVVACARPRRGCGAAGRDRRACGAPASDIAPRRLARERPNSRCAAVVPGFHFRGPRHLYSQVPPARSAMAINERSE